MAIRRLHRSLQRGQFDRGIALGALISGGLLLVCLFSGGSLGNFIDLPSFLLVIGGTFGATLVHYSMEDLGHAWAAFRAVLRLGGGDPGDRIRYLIRLGQAVKSQGVVFLDQEARSVSDGFLKMALELVADGQPADDVRRILETERTTASDHSVRAIQVFETMGAYAPALGLIGTLIGLIQMLGALNNPAAVGPAMALALVTTFYGAIAANLVFIPIAGKLRLRNQEELTLRAITIEGALSLGRQENSIMMEQRLQSYLPRAA